jgi:N-acyl-L-homoserine lactone synthetase
MIRGTGASLAPDLLRALAAYRHRVFIETLGWELPAENGLETDQFDGPGTAYVIARDPQGDVCGCARLLPTTGPYLLADVFPQLLHGAPPPRDPAVWELSRFAAAGCGAPQDISRALELQVTEHVLAHALDYAAHHGVQRFITVSPLGVERLLRRLGVHAHRAGPPVVVGGHVLFACWIEVDQQSLSAMGSFVRSQAAVARAGHRPPAGRPAGSRSRWA